VNACWQQSKLVVGSAVPVELDLAVAGRLPEYVEVAAYYVAAEALTNAAKHAQASEVGVAVKADDAHLHLMIQDNGVGEPMQTKGSGLAGLIDRVEAIGGQLGITSYAGNGTILLARIPLNDG
jgi:signal transduction histidine kinase